MAFAMVGTFLAADGLLYYIFWELALIPIYFIALIWGNGDAEERKKAVVKFFIYTLAGSLFMLVAFVYLYQKAGSFLIEDLYKLNLSAKEQLWIFLAFFLAYAIKIPLIPFHTWQANVYQKAPTVGTMLLSGIMLKMGLYSVIRWQLPIAPLAAKEYMFVFIAIGIAGVIYGSIVALRQKDLKKLLAYSLAHVRAHCRPRGRGAPDSRPRIGGGAARGPGRTPVRCPGFHAPRRAAARRGRSHGAARSLGARRRSRTHPHRLRAAGGVSRVLSVL